MKLKRIAAALLATAVVASCCTQMYAENVPIIPLEGSSDTSEEIVEGEEETEISENWEANFQYDETTGILSWDSYANIKDGLKYNVVIKGGEFPFSIGGSSTGADGWGDWRINKPNINLPLCLALASKSFTLTGNLTIVVNVSQSADEKIVAESSDSYKYTYDGCDVNTNLEVPVLTVNGNDITWSGTAGAVGYLYSTDKERIFGFNSISEETNSFTLYDDINAFAVCSIDKNGDVSEWSELYTATDDENDDYYNYSFTARSTQMLIEENIYSENRELQGISPFYIDIPGVVCGETTVGELKEICEGIIVNGYSFGGSSLEDLTAEDISTCIVVQTDNNGNQWGGWNAVYNNLKMTFDTDITVADSEIVRSILFRVDINNSSIPKLGLKAGDLVTIYFINDNTFEYEGNVFEYIENGNEIIITGGIINNSDVIIPAEINGKPVTEISYNAFDFESEIKTLVIPENVKRIDWYAFNTCPNLTEVTLPETLEYIDSWAFERCYSLKTVNIPKNVKYIGGGAFAQDTSLTSINCDPANSAYVSVDGVLFSKNMEALVAYPCGRSGSYTVPASVNHIEDAAFYGAKKLTAVEILGTLDFIGFEAFAECDLLTDVQINEGVTYVGYWAFSSCSNIKLITVPQSVTNIGDEAFGFIHYGDKMNDFTLRGYKDSAIYYYAIRHDIPFIIIGDADEANTPFKDENAKEELVVTNPDAKEEDSITSITINPAFNMKDKSEAGVGLDLTKIKIKAEEIYQDEESIKRAEEALGEVIEGNKHYNLLDLTLLYDGNDFSNGYDGLVEVIIPIPAGHRDKEFYCYRIIDNNGTPEKELIPGKRVEDAYIIYLEHFSTYAFVGDGEHEHEFRESWESDDTNHWHECSCGEITDTAAHTAGDPVIENGVKYTECSVCGRLLSEEEDPGTGNTPTTPSDEDPGDIVVPDTTTANSENTTSPDETTQASDTASEISSEPAAETGNEAPQESVTNTEAPTETTVNTENGTGASDGNNAGANDDNVNTGAVIAVIPAAAAALGVIVSRKKK